jgi:alpha-tubulin suppressor-like RCC1 family protein
MADQVVQNSLDSSAPGWPAELDEEYEYLGELGRGGMAVVYRARERALGREVAIKVVRPRFHSDEESVARLAREARTVANLEHANIVSLHAVKRLRTGLALVMQLVPGQTLKAALADGPLSVERAQLVLQDIARALDYAHRRGVVHRDVKPENIFLDDITGRALLSDFGVARSLTDNSELTATGTAIGTPTYMSPEQIDGGALDGRSDLYALGMVGWEMLSGEHPWAGESLYRVIYHQKHSALPALDEIRPDLPPRLQFLLEGMMQKRPDQRVPGAGRLLTLLSSPDELPGFKAWQRTAKRRRGGGRGGRGAGRDRTTDARSVTAGASTVKFRRDTPCKGGVAGARPTGEAGEKRQTPVPPVPIAEESRNTPWDELASGRIAVRRSNGSRGLAVAAGALVLVAALAGGWLLFRPGLQPEPTVVAGVGPVGDRRGIEVPVVPPPVADSGAHIDSMIALGTTAESALADSSAAPGAAPPPSPGRASEVVRDSATRTPVAAAANEVARARDAAPPPVTVPVESRPTSPPVVAPAPAPPSAAPSVAFSTDRGSVAAGARHSCALDTDGRATCWGNNESGQLGDGGFQSRTVAAPVAGTFSFAFLAAGNSHTCAVTRDGEGYCWGANANGQLGDGTTSARSAPVRVRGSANFRVIRTGGRHSCGLTVDGRVQCWGDNARGQLGIGSTASRTAPSAVSLGMPAGAVTAGEQHACAITIDGSAWCWGRNDNGQLGDGSAVDRSSPVPVAGNHRFISIAAGGFHTCAVATDQHLYCWGRNRWGQLGTGGVLDARVPQRVDVETAFVTVSAGLGHTCARARDGRGWCWGRNAYGQLGDGTVTDRSAPTPVRGVGAFSALNATGSHTCGESGGDVYCWGWNVDGQLGVGNRESVSTPSRISGGDR